MTPAELNAQLNTDIKQSVLNAVTSIKTYVDGKDEILKSELTEQIVAELSEIDGLGGQLEKIKEMADAFAKVFDENEDGKITPEEILAKLTSLKSEIEKIDLKVDKVADDLLGAIDRIKVLEANVSKNAEQIAIIKQTFVKNEDLNSIKIDVKSISDAVNDILNPTTDGDGAVE